VTHGLRQIVRFNWPFYAVATTAVTAAAPVIAMLPVTIGIRSLLYSATGLAGFWIAASLVASWIVYDRSRLTEWDWIREALGFRPLAWLNIHAGLDESTPSVRRLLAPSQGRVFDIFDPVDMTEPSIVRARRLGRAPRATEPVEFRCRPMPAASVDAAFLLLSAHELRTDAARGALFAELHRVLRPAGRVIVAEHLRDCANFAAFGPGFLHFMSRQTWKRSFARARFVIHTEFSITPFVRVFVLRRSV
jgi:SAM-dependent methyltransferase